MANSSGAPDLGWLSLEERRLLFATSGALAEVTGDFDAAFFFDMVGALG